MLRSILSLSAVVVLSLSVSGCVSTHHPHTNAHFCKHHPIACKIGHKAKHKLHKGAHILHDATKH